LAQQTEHRTFGKPDETRGVPNGQAEILKIGGLEIGRLIFQPGWGWSNDDRPIAATHAR
jgi:hypothetical protein